MADDLPSNLRSPNRNVSVTHALTPVSSPFVGTAAHCFLKVGLWIDRVSSKRRGHPTQNLSLAEAMSVEHHASLKGAVHPWLGVGSCSLAAVCCTAIFYTSSFKNILPFVFLGIIILVTLMFGRSAGVLGTLSAALIFASVLFEPRPSLAMEDPIAQTHLMWMMVIGVVVAYWLGRDPPHNTSP